MSPAPLKTMIVDDEPLAIERLQILCARLPGLSLVGTAGDGAGALRLIEALAPDLILLDIQMPEMDGMAVARALAGRAHRPAVIFVTAFDQFAVAAFDVAAADYLLKPVAPDRLERAIDRVRGQLGTAAAAPSPVAATGGDFVKDFWVPHRAEIVRIAASEIDLISAERDYMRLHVGPKSYLMHETIMELERKLDPGQFVRIHRSTIVNRARITGFKHDGAGAWHVQLRDGQSFRVGRTYLANARAIAGR
ncbi:MAG: LytTR family DNA-binding domain-containing protein [Rhodospirillaceae bacterium]|nr:LytTR family DNA-binding domain-containing protein [Rhodospirillaceae bacterium]